MCNCSHIVGHVIVLMFLDFIFITYNSMLVILEDKYLCIFISMNIIFKNGIARLKSFHAFKDFDT